MGNKVSHEETTDHEDGHSGLRDLFKHKRESAVQPSSLQTSNEGADHDQKDGNNDAHDQNDSENNLQSSYSSSPGLKTDNVAKLAKELVHRSSTEEECDGIGLKTFSKYVCQGNGYLGHALFKDAFKNGKTKKSSQKPSLSKEQFVSWAQKVSQLIGDEKLLTYYVQIFANDENMLSMEDVNHFFQSCYHLSMGTNNPPEHCDKTLQMVLSAMFHGKAVLGSKYVIHWIEENCPRVVTWMHRNLVHQLTVGIRLMRKKNENHSDAETDSNRPTNLEMPVLDTNLQREFFNYATSPSSFSPLQKKSFTFVKQMSETQCEAEQLLSLTRLHQMQIWFLGCTLPTVFIRPQQLQHSQSTSGLVLMDPHLFIMRMIASQNPTHWIPLYNSDNDGLSLNRFEHHVLDYRGPTVTFLHAEGNRIFCLAVEMAWKESIHFWGSSNTMILQLAPEYRVLDRGEKIMYYNTSARGYPFGIQIGSNHRDPQVAIDKEFSLLSYRKIPYRLEKIQVWGCGSIEQRELQLDHKKWEMKQVEKSRQVKLSAVDWNDHPDRHLLELASHRPNYSQYGNS